ncbi:dTMP kinase [Pseudoflavonifractor phocaeensis]|uniref:dTMP kinase n=1 Tax=Pseudoflavonifractor phocaeensis TaxID=1870988 RepID=UPI00195DC1A0|nr:thymidylate kinase [Pseudoflavonifractor phocaeensis]MBM6871597.1 thymidylate kinase [Pseudoflavonifractor phocaeensis]
MAGTLIVCEGTDGSGKSTQFSLLCRRLEQMETPFRRLVFPQYSQPSSALIRMYLGGAFGSHPSDVNAYAASSFYAVDRYASWKQVWGEDYRSGGLILSDRYTSSNAVHQACKLPEEAWEDFFRWLDDFEHNKLGLPRPDLVLYLDMPTEWAVSLLRSREAQSHTKGDIHEVDTAYLALCRRTARKAAACLGWTTISCVRDGVLRAPADIQEELWAAVSPYIRPVKG